MTDAQWREAVVDLDAISSNVRRMREITGVRTVIAVVKADGYGHGAVPSARAALAGGADWLGVADLTEALALRRAGITAPVLSWLHGPDAPFAEAIAANISIGVSSVQHVDALALISQQLGSPARVQLKLDTGLSRNGIPRADWAGVFATASEHQREGLLQVDGIFSHVSNASVADDQAAVRLFEEGRALAARSGLVPPLVHVAATAAALSVPDARYDAIRVGIGIYGLSPLEGTTSSDLGLTPAMTLRARVVSVRRVAAGTGVSYGYSFRAERDTTLALVPLGYADGIPRQASNRGTVAIGGSVFPVAGRIAMDQFIVDVGDARVAIGDTVTVFGDPTLGVPSAEDWARAADTINYEIVTRIGSRVPRSYRGGVE